MCIYERKSRQQSSLDFWIMSLIIKIRDLRLPRINILTEVGIKTGSVVLDYGCGPGSYIIPLTTLVGESGLIYALDINGLAIKKVQNIASRKRLVDVRTILSDCETGLQSDSVDVVLLYDILHDLDNRNSVLQELHRILKVNGILSVSDHHMKKDDIVSAITNGRMFKLSAKNKRTLSFAK